MPFILFLMLAGSCPHSDIVPRVVASPNSSGDKFAIFLSGDGGWWPFARATAEEIAADGIPVVGVSSREYFQNRRTPNAVADDLSNLADCYLSLWGKKEMIWIGYSFGADVLPFIINRLRPDLRARSKGVILLAPSGTAEFSIHDEPGTGPPVSTELSNIRGIPSLCLYGERDRASLCPKLKPDVARVVKMKGGHHFNFATQLIASIIAH